MTVLLIFDFKRLHVTVVVLLYADDILLALPGRGAQQVADLRAVLYVLQVFGYFSGLRVNFSKTYAVVKCSDPDAPRLTTLAGLTVKEQLKYLGIQLGNVTTASAYAPVVAKMLARARTLATLPLGMEERVYLFATWVAPVVYLTARPYAPTEHVVAQLDMVHRAALDINNWHLTMPILALPPAEGGLGQVGLGLYASWVHSQTFVQAVMRPASLAEQHARPFRGWADRVGLILEPAFLPYLQLASIPLTKPTFLQGTVKAYSVVRRGQPPPPLHELWSLGVWQCVFFRNKVWLTYFCPALHRKGVLRWCDLILGSKIPPQLLDTVAPTWRDIYVESAVRVVGMYKPSFVPPATPPVDNWPVQWTKRRSLLAMQQRTRHEARQSKEVWRVFGCLHLPKWDLDFIRRVLWRKLPVGVRMERLGGELCPQCGRVEDHAHTLKRCYFSAFMFDTVRKAFGVAQGVGAAVEPSRLLLEEPLLSLQTTQGLVLWAGLRAQWKLRCEVKYQHRQVSLEDFVAVWVGVLESWRGERNMSCS